MAKWAKLQGSFLLGRERTKNKCLALTLLGPRSNSYNWLYSSLHLFSMRLYADDSSLTVAGKNKDTLLYQINLELPYIYDWLCANKLTLNLKMTKYLVFQPRQKINFNLLPPLILAAEILGIVIDHHLFWHDHIDYVCDKIRRCINIMTKVKSYLGKHCVISIYYSLVYSYLVYGCLL